MNQLQDVKDQIFYECQDSLRQISAIEDAEALVEHQEVFYRISEKIAVLKALANLELPLVEQPIHNFDHEPVSFEKETDGSYFEDDHFSEAIVDGQTNDVQTSEFAGPAELPAGDNPKPEPMAENDKEAINNKKEEADVPMITDEGLEEELISEALLSEEAYERNVEALDRQPDAEAEKEPHDLRAIRDIEPHHPKKVQSAEEKAEEKLQQEKKIKLASIKALNKNLHSLFDDDPLETPQVQQDGTLQKANMPTDFMEAPKTKPDFKLDLNDRIAFTQKLFGGSQTELNDAIQHLNAATSLEDAKVYLSDLYYERNWKKVDDYAQRLWMLVENKFL